MVTTVLHLRCIRVEKIPANLSNSRKRVLILFSAAMPAATTSTRVLIVDDDAMSRELLGVLLEAEGYVVESAESGEAALALLDRGRPCPDVVLADVQMPGLTAAQLAGRLRRACGRTTPLLAMSGSRPPEATIARFDGFLLKPFTMQQVADALAAHTLSRTPANAAAKKRAKGTTGQRRMGDLISLHAAAPEIASNLNNMNKQDMQPPDAVPADATDAPVLDEAIYGKLAGSMPAPQLKEMYSMCVNDARTRIASMRSLVAAQDSAQFIREAHAIKGSCGMLQSDRDAPRRRRPREERPCAGRKTLPR